MRALIIAFLLLAATSSTASVGARAAKKASSSTALQSGKGNSLSENPLESTYYPVDPKTGRGPWNKIVALGDIHGDMDQALILLKETGVVTHQPAYYSEMVLKQARMAGSSAYGEAYQKQQQQKGGKKGASGTASSGKSTDQQKVDDGLGNFLPKDIAANMIYNKRGDVMKGVTADEYHWGIGKALVVILGDCMNVGPDDIAAVTLIRRLTREADLAGGKLVFVLGNHEVMNLRNDFSGVHPWSFERTGGALGRKRILSTGTELGRFLRSRPGIFYYDNLMFMHGGLFPGAIKVVERETGKDNLQAGALADVINKHVRAALFDNEEDVAAMDKDPIAATVVNVNYDENGKNGILLVHPLEECDKIERANNMTGLESQIVGHTPHDLPKYSFCNDALYGIDLKNSKWKGGSGAMPAALVLLREELAGYLMRNPNPNAVNVPPPPALADKAVYKNQAGSNGTSNLVAAGNQAVFDAKGHSITAARDADYRWTSRLVIPKEVYEQTQQRVGGWTSISALGYVLWVALLVAVCETGRLIYKFCKKRDMVPKPLTRRVDNVTAFCDVIASYMPCAGSIYSRGMPLRRRGDGEYEDVDGEDGGHQTYHSINGTSNNNLKPTKSAPF